MSPLEYNTETIKKMLPRTGGTNNQASCNN